jgi:hypothetical protein
MWFPLFVFTIFRFAGGKDEFYSRFSPIFPGLAKLFLNMDPKSVFGYQVLFWHKGFLPCFVWDGVIAGISGRPVPRMP